MKQNMCDFSTAKVGDRVWSIQHGDSRIIKIGEGEKPIIIGNHGYWHVGYYIDGKLNWNDEVPSLYWSNPNIIAPPAPKRKVKKVIEGWINVYGTSIRGLHKTKEEADEVADSCRIACIHIYKEYEVEE